MAGSSRFCVISLTYIGSINLCVLCVFVVRSTSANPIYGYYSRYRNSCLRLHRISGRRTGFRSMV
ncbi:hypothetical protein [Microcystis aeruginosa]|uniref:hypothetical protein n=1 Tax=Microcystis aeruginosa TaxID=1126 RepID=UPI001F502279|nr:hypothetical protein [Microcystis aeruginosa]MDB9415457.1 hypothetical protein [Microcystis aeruginosa CS-556/03]